jgi:heterogeneous nuclear rnp K-like protein 2
MTEPEAPSSSLFGSLTDLKPAAAAPDGADLEAGDAPSIITLRSLVTSKEAGAIIGKGGKNVADLREKTGVKAGVSKPVAGVHDRVLTVTGPVEGVTVAYAMAAQTLVQNPSSPYSRSLSPPPPAGVANLRLLIPHQQMGSVIGRQGLKIKSIQESAKVRMVASKEMLPQSTERIVEIQGTPEAVQAAVGEVCQCLLEDWERAAGSILYTPQPRYRRFSAGSGGGSGGGGAGAGEYDNSNGGGGRGVGEGYSESSGDAYQEISIPADMVGCIIGKGGAKIQEIRRESGARISIAKQAMDETGERLFTIRGSKEANERALVLLYQQLENEKNRRREE